MSNITVLTPAYNRGKLLEKLYESLCAQDCKDFEWLIVDDGSTDDTSERVEQMKQTADFPISYHKKENGGRRQRQMLRPLEKLRRSKPRVWLRNY